MQRRIFLQLLGVLPFVAPAMAVTTKYSISGPSKLLVQNSPLAGFAYYQGESLWKQLYINDSLKLVREPDNTHDRRAVAVYWREHKLGFVPRVANTAVSQMLDRGLTLQAQIIQLDNSGNPWKRIHFSVYAAV